MKFGFSVDQVALAFVLSSAAPLSIACNATSDGSPFENGMGGSAVGNGGAQPGVGGAQGMGGAVGNGGTAGPGGSSAAGGIAPIGNGGGAPIGNGGSGPSGNGGSVATGGAASGGRGSAGMPGGGSSGGGGAPGGSGCVQDLKCMPAAPNTGDIYADCVARVNQFRACVCLPPLQQWKDGEACANQDATYDAQHQSEGAHAGFKAKICTAGSAQDECPGYRSNDQVISGCLQQMFNEGPPPMMPCSGTCYQQHGHFINMTNTRYTSVACGFFTYTDGKIWAVQNFK